MNNIIRSIKKQVLGFHRSNKRIWINHGTITGASLNAGDSVEYIYDEANTQLIIKKSPNGTHKIASTHKGGVIDIVNARLTTLFKDHEYVDVITENEKIIVKGHWAKSQIIEREQALIRRVQTGEPIRKGGGCAGIGLLCRSIHRGIKQAGIAVKQRFANESNELAAEVNMSGNEIWHDATDDAVFVVDDMFTMDFSLIPKLDVLVIGSPCTPFSQVNTHMRRDAKTDIFHPSAGTTFQPILEMIRRSNPAVVLLENSKFFSDSIFDYVMSDVMKRFGYRSQSTVVTGKAHGDFEIRERLCRFWISEGLPEIDLNDLPFQMENDQVLADILEPISDEDSRWGRRKYLEAKDKESHNAHRYCITPLNASTVPTLGANYHKIQPDSCMIEHPSKPLVTRILTASEHCNLRGIEGCLKEQVQAVEAGVHYSQQSNRTNAKEAHRMLGNSCAPKAWISVGYRFGEWMKSLVTPVKPVRVEEKRVIPEQMMFSFLFQPNH